VPKNNWKGKMSGLKEKFSKILVAIDGSRPSMDAVGYAITIAQRNEAELTALYVVSSQQHLITHQIRQKIKSQKS
jgi:nucleotide-binding universal stress UspA family protein